MNRRRLAPDLVAVVARQLSDAMRAGLSLRDTLAILSKDTDLGKRQIELIAHLRENQASGGALSTALAEYPDTFPPEAVALVQLGERDGVLAESLELIATDFELRALLRLGTKGALSWPAAILSVLLIITAVIMIFVIPAFKSVFTSFGADLPGPTLLFIAISDFAVEWWYVVAGLIGFAVFMVNSRRVHLHRIEALDAALMKVPFIRAYLVKTFILRLSHILASATRGRLPLAPALGYLRATAGNTALRRLAGALETQLADGKDLVSAVRDAPHMPGHLVVALELGVAGNNLGATLGQLAAWGESEAARSLVRLQQALLISAYIAVGLIVGCTVIAMYLPIFKLGSAV